jgi:hypothetical protein
MKSNLILDMPWRGRRTYEALKGLPELLQSFVQLTDLTISLPRGRGRELSRIIEERSSPFVLNITSLSTSFAGSMLTRYCPKLVECHIHNTREYDTTKDFEEFNMNARCKILSLEYPEVTNQMLDSKSLYYTSGSLTEQLHANLGSARATSSRHRTTRSVKG